MSRVYFSSVNIRKSCKYIQFTVRGGLTRVDELLRVKQTERNNSESNAFYDRSNCKGTIVIGK